MPIRRTPAAENVNCADNGGQRAISRPRCILARNEIHVNKAAQHQQGPSERKPLATASGRRGRVRGRQNARAESRAERRAPVCVGQGLGVWRVA